MSDTLLPQCISAVADVVMQHRSKARGVCSCGPIGRDWRYHIAELVGKGMAAAMRSYVTGYGAFEGCQETAVDAFKRAARR
jgi:hypothetical protein